MRFTRLDIKLFLISVAIGLGGISILYVGSVNQLVQEKDDIEYNLKREISNIQREIVPVLESLENNSDFTFQDLNGVNPYPFFVYRAGRIAYWSDYRYVPEYRKLRGDYRYKFIQDLRKSFLVRRWEIEDKALEIYALLPLYTGYKIENDYIQSGYNPRIFPIQNVRLTQTSSLKGELICLGAENCPFKVEIESEYNIPVKTSSAGIWLIFLSLFLLVVVLYRTARKVACSVGVYKGLALLIIGLLLFRWIMLGLNFPHIFSDSVLFKSSYFASSDFNPSLGDLLINMSFFCLSAFFLFYHQQLIVSTFVKKGEHGVWKWLIPVLLVGLGFLIVHFLFLIFQTLYHNSQLTFDINESLTFDLGRVAGYAIVLLFIATIFFIFHVLFMVVRSFSLTRSGFLISVVISALLFSLANLLLEQDFLLSLVTAAGILLLVEFTGLYKSVNKLRYRTFLYFFIFMMGGAFLGSFSIYNFEKEASYKKKKRFANQLLIQNDNLAEFLLGEANKKIKDDRFIQSTMSSPFLGKDIVEAKIRQEHLSNYLDKYSIEIYLFNSSKQPFKSSGNVLTPDYVQKLDKYETNYPGIYFINSPSAQGSKRYLNLIEIRKRGLVVGYVIIDLNLKRIIPESVYPELLVDHRLLMPFQNNNYSYAIFQGNKIQYSSGDFNYQLDFSSALFNENKLFETAIHYEEYWHTAVRDADSRVVVISSEDHPITDVFSNFSFLFLLQVFIILIALGIYSIYFALQTENLNYSAKIQLYLNLAFFMPLIAVSVTTLSLINSSFEKEVNQEYFKKAESISNNVSDELNNYVTRVSINQEELRSKLTEVSKYSGADVNLFNTSGKLIASSQPQIFENDLLSEYINPVAFHQIKERGKNSYILQESVGGLIYNTTFFAVKSFQRRELIGIVSIPYFKSEFNLEQSQITVLTNVINVFTVVFIIFLILSYLASNWLTFPLRFITQKLKKTTLTETNEPLNWETNDEIGLMVGEYNKMLENLEQSKRALAKSEKESAWREIAQQVAHEIKNPLTPMKLTLQHMNRKITEEDKKGELKRPMNTLLQQIETLNDIASSFSTFAKMPIPEQERYELTHIIKNAVSLHKANKAIQIDLQIDAEPVYTIGDEQLMGRIINNIILNAIQSATDTEPCVKVSMVSRGLHKVRLEIADNGTGIRDEVRAKVFIPNFSTKERGSGIGLAIAKHGIEHAGGEIWFETELDEGTSFFIELPVAP
ncbi:MAG: ATP-binding protein [Bacteroidota bacterium]